MWQHGRKKDRPKEKTAIKISTSSFLLCLSIQNKPHGGRGTMSLFKFQTTEKMWTLSLRQKVGSQLPQLLSEQVTCLLEEVWELWQTFVLVWDQRECVCSHYEIVQLWIIHLCFKTYKDSYSNSCILFDLSPKKSRTIKMCFYSSQWTPLSVSWSENDYTFPFPYL